MRAERALFSFAISTVLGIGCSSSAGSHGNGASGESEGGASGTSSSGSGLGVGGESDSDGAPASSGAGSSGSGASSGSTSGGGSSGAVSSEAGASSGASSDSGSSGTFPTAGNPSGSCTTLTLPAEAQPVDTSHPTTVVGTGTPASCTFQALSTAVKGGGIITFNCGPNPVTISVTATLKPPISTGGTAVHIVIDGGNEITLDGGGSVQIISWVHATWRTSQDTLTLQHIQLSNGKATGTKQIPACTTQPNSQCSTGYTDGQGGAVYMADGSLRVIDSIFTGNQAAKLGPDTGGGALYLDGSGTLSYVAHSTFQNNTASNAGAIGMLWVGASIYNSLFEGNSAVGTGANSVDSTNCSCDDGNGDQVGSGGNGGAIYKDGGDGVNLTLCGDLVENNSANEFGSGVFLTADGSAATLIMDDSVIKDNPSPITYWNWCLGVSTDTTSTSPQPIMSSFCDTCGTCQTTCSSSATCGK
ncbi:MAG: hypothetical protein ACLP1X_21240 [Polyangiaceae bacterium]|jgi:hypothetical protein